MGVECLVPISGGKDSQACLELALKQFPASEVRGLFCDTLFEHPITYKHIGWMSHNYGIEIDRVNGGTVLGKSVKYGRFPGGGARHCTDELKIRETKIYCKELAERQDHGFEVWYGMRRKESSARAKRYAGKISSELYPPHLIMPSKYPRYLEKLGVMFRLPIVDWHEDEVMELLDGRENPLYAKGFPRVGCFPCLASGDKWKEKAFFESGDFGREQYIATDRIATQIGKSIWTSKGGKARNEDNPGCAICAI